MFRSSEGKVENLDSSSKSLLRDSNFEEFEHSIIWSSCYWSIGGLLMCYFLTTFLSPIWNFSANSYFKSTSKYSWTWTPVGGLLPCWLDGTCGCPRDVPLEDLVGCAWFSFKFFTDTFIYYGFLIAGVCLGAYAHTHDWRWAQQRYGAPQSSLAKWCECFPSGLTYLEAFTVFATCALFITWFVFWTFLYGRFWELDFAHDCYASEDDRAPIPLPGCEDGMPATGRGYLHVVCRSMGHMASLALSLTMLPVGKHNVLLAAMGLSWEQVLHWHRGLGAVAYGATTLHMALWWIKWYLDGTLAKNVWDIDIRLWMWVTPTWNHYENWSVMMAQLAWIFLTVALVIAWTVRRTMYKLFYLTHHLAVIFMLFGIVHAWSFWFFAFPGMVLWYFDRLARLLATSENCTVVKFAAVPNTEVTLLEVYAPRLAARFRPGQYAWLCVPGVSRSEQHPFTVNVDGEKLIFLIAALGQPNSWSRRLLQLSRASYPTGGESFASPAAGTMVVGTFAGLSSRHFASSPLLLVAGGIGITPVISVFRSALRAKTRNVTLVWSVQSSAMLDLPFVKDVLLEAVSSEIDQLRVYLHVTRGEIKDSSFAGCKHVKVASGRPDLKKLVSELVEGFEGSRASAGIFRLAPNTGFGFACGPPVMQDEVAGLCNQHGFEHFHVETFLF